MVVTPFNSFRANTIFFLFSCLLLCASGDIAAQNPDTLRVIDLNEFQVNGTQTRNAIDRLPAVHGTMLVAGKKNEVIRMATLDADLSTNNARQVFAKVPGVSVWENDGSGIQVGIAARGLSPNRSWEFNVRQNGYDICAEAFGYPEAYYSPPMEAVDRIELVRGSASLQFGPQFGGLLNYHMKKGVPGRKVAFETRQTMGSYGLVNTYNALGGTVGKLSYYAFFHHRNAEGWRANSRYAVNTGHASLTYALSKRSTIGLEYTRMGYVSQQAGGLTDRQFELDHRSSSRDRNWFNAPWNVASLSMDHVFTDHTRINIKLFTTIAERNSVGFLHPINEPDTIDRATGSFASRQVDRDNYTNVGAEIRVIHKHRLLGIPSNLAFGGRWYQGRTDRKQHGTGTTGSDMDLSLAVPEYGKEFRLSTGNIAGFAENEFRPVDRLSVVPGVRYEFIDASISGRINSTSQLPATEKQRMILLYGAGLEFRTSRSTNVYANYSRAYRPVLFSELIPSATTDVIDPDLKDATGYNADIGFRGTVLDHISFDVGAFLLQYNDRVGTVLRDGVAFRTNVGASRSQGLESYIEIDPVRSLLKHQRFGTVKLFASIALIDARYTRWNNPALANDPVHGIAGKRVENAPEHIERYGMTYIYKRFSTTVQLSAVGDVFTDASNTVAPNATGTTGRLPGYEVMDVSANWGFSNGMELKAGINNLTDERYATRRAGGYPGPGVLPANGRTMYLTVAARF